MTLTPEIIALLLLDGLFLLFGSIAFVLSVRIYLKWDFDSSSELQYSLEKQSYLVSVVIKYIFTLKLPLFLFYIFTCNKLSAIITGAMCAAGVVNSVSFGLYLLIFKLLNLYLFGLWLLLNRADLNEERQPYTRLKFLLFGLAFFFLITELLLEISFFSSLNISKIVSCCGTLFSAVSTSYLSLLFHVDKMILVGFFYFFLGLVGLGFWLKNKAVFIFANALYLIFAVVTLIVFFSTYVYELPTHNCPFCLLQKEYYGVGYWLYISLFIGTFYGMCGGILTLITKGDMAHFYRVSLLFNTLYALSVSLYPLLYVMRNGVWL